MSKVRGKRIRRCDNGSGSRSVGVLPLLIQDEILCRLPVKSLLRFKSVCKIWYSVIKSPEFISTHYHHQSNRVRPLFHERYLCGDDQPIAFNPKPDTKRLGCCWPLVNPDPDEKEEGGNLLFSYYIGMTSLCIFLRPVNGVVLIVLPNRNVDRCRMAMLNLATKQFRFLIDFEFNTRSPGTVENHVFGYGIISTSTTPHVYKVVWLNRPLNMAVVVAKVFIVGGDRDGDWRIINAALPTGFVHNYSDFPNTIIFMNGKCYWLSKDFAHILVFDMDKEVFREMKSPLPTISGSLDELVPKFVFDTVFTEVQCCGGEGDSLALFVFESGFVDISVMDKEEEWHWNRRVVSYIPRPISDFLNPLMQLQFPMTDSILLKARSQSFFLYNPKTNRCERFGGDFHAKVSYFSIRVFNFKQSLFSVDGGIQVSERVLEDFCTF